MYFHGGCAAKEATPETLNLLARCYDAIAGTAPTLNLIPLLQSLGWDAAAVARGAPEVTRLFTPSHSQSQSQSNALSPVVEAICRERVAHNLPPLTTTEKVLPAATTTPSNATPPPPTTTSATPFHFTRVSVGGTFDRMHAGHRLLLAVASAITPGATAGTSPARRPALYVGVTAAELLTTKTHWDLIQPYEARAAAARSFLAATRPPPPPQESAEAGGGAGVDVDIQVGPLDLSPPLAATVEDMEALVISRETTVGGEALNALRSSSGFAPVALVVVGLVGEQEGRVPKLSSTALRQAEAEPRP